MSSEELWDQIKKEIDRLKTDEEFKLFRGTLEKIENLTNVGIAGQVEVSGEEVRNALELIKGMQKEVKAGVNPREVFERVLSESDRVQMKVEGGESGDRLIALRDAYKVGGDLNQAQRDVIKASNVYVFNVHYLLSESYKELKRSLEQILIQVVLLVMTKEEAQELDSEAIFERFKNPVLSQQFGSLRQQLTEAQIDDALQNYGDRPEDWRPFPDRSETISQAVSLALKQVPGFNKPLAADFREIRALTPEVDEQKFRASLKLMREEGCLVIMDVISMQHPVIQRAYRRSLLDVFPNIPVLRVAPAHSVLSIEQEMLNFGDRYQDLEIYKRLNWDYDDSCREVSALPGLGRWITGQAPDLLKRREHSRQTQATTQSVYKDVNGAA